MATRSIEEPPAKRQRIDPERIEVEVEQTRNHDAFDSAASPCHASPPHSEHGSSPGVNALPPQQRISMYVEAFEEMMNVVLSQERFLFCERELATLDRWPTMSCALRLSRLCSASAV